MDARSLARALDIFRRSTDLEVGTQTFAAYLHIATNPGCTVSQVLDALGLAQSSASRNVSYLLAERGYRQKGFGLVLSEINPKRRTEKLLYLTPKGQRLLEELEAS